MFLYVNTIFGGQLTNIVVIFQDRKKIAIFDNIENLIFPFSIFLDFLFKL